MEKHTILYLQDKDLHKLGVTDMAATIADVEKTFELVSGEDSLTPFKVAMEWPVEKYGHQNRINAMPAYLGGEIGMAGVKWIGSNPDNTNHGLPRASALTILNDPITKLPVCIMDGTSISAMRTGAAGGVAVKYLSKPDSKVALVFGAGVQSRTQLEAACCVRPSLTECYVYDPLTEKAEAFAKEMSEKLGVSVSATTQPKEICQKADVVITATVANDPIIHSSWLKPGCTYVHIGGNECTYGAVLKADKIVFDKWADVLHRQGSTSAIMGAKGILTEDRIYADLGEIIAGKKPGRESDTEYIYFNAVGMGAEDIAVATRLYRKALAEGVGMVLPYWGE